jgi:integrase/recombinase XerD
MTSLSEVNFKQNYQTHFKQLKLKGLHPKTVDAYLPAIRCFGEYFNSQLNDLSETQLLEYFSGLLETHSWSSVKLDLYCLKFFYIHVLHKPGCILIWSSHRKPYACRTSSLLRKPSE